MNVLMHAPARPFSAGQWKELILTMLTAVEQAQTPVNLYLERDERLAWLNAAFMGQTGPTNVLSFPGRDMPGQNIPGQNMQGQNMPAQDMPAEICISYDALLRESRMYGQQPENYAIFLLAHGLGHILGYDHGPQMDTICRRMTASALESKII